MPDTLVDMFFANAERLGEKAVFHEKVDGAYKEISYNTAAEKATNFAYGLRDMGIDAGDHVAIYSENRPEWAYSDLAILSLGAVVIPIYATLTISQAEYIFNNSQSKVIIVSQPEKLEDIKKVFNNLKTVKRIITMFDHSEDDSKLVLSFDEVIRAGIEARRKNPKLLGEIKQGLSKDDVVSILYTSGTTGDPKGVMLTNHNFISNVESVLGVYDIFEEDLFLSFLPLSHVFERLVGYYLPLYVGSSIAYAQSPLTVGDNMREVHPTVMASVPRLYEKMYNLVQDNVSKGSAVKKLIFKGCLRAGKKHFKQAKKGKVSSVTAFKFRLADKLVFGKLRGRTGGRIRFFVSGGAPLIKEIGEFFAYAGIKIVEAYGLTETSPGITGNPFNDCRFGTVGKPLPGIEVKIAEDGEICTRGPHVMKGYFNDPEATKEVIDDEGWFYTGDVGIIDDDGFLTITDRKKNIIVTSGGKNIAPQPIENTMLLSRYIDQVLMIGDKRKFPSGIIVPAFDNVKDYFQLQDITFKSRKEMIKDPRTYELIQSEIDRLSENLSNYEKIKKVILLDEEFSQENGELTPSLKIKRRIIEKKFAKQLDNLYST